MAAGANASQTIWPDDKSSGDAAFGSGEPERICYAGILGRCLECNSQGSCLCGSNSNGMTDFLVMDRDAWDESTLLCPNVELVLILIHALACLFVAILFPGIIRAIQSQVQQARSSPRASYLRAPRLVLLGVLMGTVCVLLFSVSKLAFPSRLVGIDPLLSLALTVKNTASAVALEAHLYHVVSVALNSQVMSLGGQRVFDAKARQYRLSCIKVSLFTTLSFLPLIQNGCTWAGYCTSVKVQAGFWVAFALGRAVHSALVLLLLRIETKVLCNSFLKSIEAAEAAYIIASGKRVQQSSRANKSIRATPESLAREKPFKALATSSAGQKATNEVPAHLQSLLTELESLESSYNNIRTNSRAVNYHSAFSTLIWLLLASIPPVWRASSYIIPLSSLFWLHGSRSFLKLYTVKQRPSDGTRDSRISHILHPRIYSTRNRALQSV